MSVCAVVVTYNRSELLEGCLDAIDAQVCAPEQLIVVDNASTDGTAELLAGRGGLEHVRLARNLGSSGGFARGIELARERECEWLWLMDDDCAPRRDTLARLLAAAPARDASTVALCPKVVHADGSLDRNQRGDFRRRLRPLPASAYVPGRYVRLGFMSFVGALVRVAAARTTAPPKAEFFVWGDDVEYSLRLRRLGDIRLVSEAEVVHRRVAHAHSNARSRFWNSVLPVELYPTPLERFWQNLCGLRNYIWTKREYERQSTISAVGTTAQFMVKHLLYDEQPLRRMTWIARYARDGRAGRFDNIAPDRWAEMVRRGEV